MTEHNDKKVLLCQPFGNVLNNPLTAEIIATLVDSGYVVECFSKKNKTVNQVTKGLYFKEDPFIWSAAKEIVREYICFQWLSNICGWIDARRFANRNFCFVISVDRAGVLEATAITKKLGTVHYHLSYEIFFADETSPRYKRIERAAYKNVTAVIIQDRLRAELFCQENDVSLSKISLIPLCLRKNAASPDFAPRARDLCGIPLDKKVLISIGSLADWSMAREIIQQVCDLPKEWVLLMNERFGDARELEAYVESIGMTGRIYFNSSPVRDIRDIKQVLQGCSFGLAFYKPTYKSKYTGKNIKNIGLASGKLVTFLSHELPVITNIEGQARILIERYRAGVVVQDPAGINQAVETSIDAKGPAVLFSTIFDYDLYETKIKKLLAIG